MAMPKNRRLLILAPIVIGRRGEYRQELEDARKAGYARARINGVVVDLAEDIQLERNKHHDIEIVVDRIKVKSDIRSRVAEAVELALRMGNGILTVNIKIGLSAEAIPAPNARLVINRFHLGIFLLIAPPECVQPVAA